MTTYQKKGPFIKRFTFSILLIFILMLNYIVIETPEAAAQEIQSKYIEFEFQQRHWDIDVGPGDSKLLRLKGKVRFISPFPSGRQVVLNLKIKCTHDPDSEESLGGWRATVSPPIMSFNTGEQDVWRDITVTVIAYQFDNKGATYDVELGGNWRVNPGTTGDIEPYVLSVTANQYYMLRVSSINSFITGYPGERRTYTLDIMNQGNGLDSFEIDFLNLDSLEEAGFVIIAHKKETDDILPDQSANFTFDIIGPQKSTFYRTRVTEVALVVTSEGSGKNELFPEFMHSSVFYQERGTYYDIEPCLASMLIILILIPGLFYLYNIRKGRKGIGKKRRMELNRSKEKIIKEYLPYVDDDDFLSEDEYES